MPRYLSAIALAITAILALPVRADLAGGWSRGWEWGGGWGHMIFGTTMMILFWGGIILLIVLAVRWIGGAGGSPRQSDAGSNAIEILKDRYARGEIDNSEFEERKRALSH